MWNILQRELRELARQDALYGLRVFGAGIMTVLLWLAWERAEPGPGTSGRGFFIGLNRLLFIGIWLVGPVLTADCLSREKRDGTLGLLFLTPLRPVDIVVGKAFSQAARAFLFVLAALPVMVIPALIGGVMWLDALRMLFIQLGALGLALAAGLAASSLTTSWWRARLLALGFASGAGLIFIALHLSALILPAYAAAPANGSMPSLSERYLAGAQGLLTRCGLGPGTGFDQFWQAETGIRIDGRSVAFAAGVWIASWFLVAVIIGLAAIGIRRTWRPESPSASCIAAGQVLAAVRFRRRRWSRIRSRQLDRNPVRWLQSRTWDARVTGWLLAGAAVLGWRLTTDGDRWMPESSIALLRPALMGAVAFAATASFRAERESGALELWLVTPLTPATILRGRLGGLQARFAGAAAVLIVLPYLPMLVQTFTLLELPTGRRPWLTQRLLTDLDFCLWLAATALLGTALSLSRLSFLPAFGLSWVIHHVPVVVTAVGEWAANRDAPLGALPVVVWNSRDFLHRTAIVGAGIVLLWSWWFGRRQLDRRAFLPGIGSPRLPTCPIPSEVRAP